MSSNSSAASVANDAEARSHTKSDDREDLQLSLNRVRLNDSSNRAEGPVRFPGFVLSPPLHVQGDVSALLIPRLDQARGPCLCTQFKIYYAFFSLIILG